MDAVSAELYPQALASTIFGIFGFDTIESRFLQDGDVPASHSRCLTSVENFLTACLDSFYITEAASIHGTTIALTDDQIKQGTRQYLGTLVLTPLGPYLVV